jgi:hypothetical protein
MPFDEPALAIIGMWTLGGGPNPHFSLALGRMMDSLGQREIAWNAYERTVEMADHFWSDPAIRDHVVAQCRKLQHDIANSDGGSELQAWEDRHRAAHISELAWGVAYQKAYEDFEASRIAAGIGLDDPDFYKPFFQSRPSIASDPRLADDIRVRHYQAISFGDFFPCLVLGAGIFTALAVRFPNMAHQRKRRAG